MPRDDWARVTPETIFNGLYPHGRMGSVLDVGCGLSIKSQYIECERIVALDIFRPYLEQGRAQAVRDDILYIQADALDIGNLFLPKSFDLVLVQDVIEHLEKADGWKLLDMAEGLAKQAVIANTPHGYFPQNIDTWGLGGDVWQTHRSAWYPGDFARRGYHTQCRIYRPCKVKRHTDYDIPDHPEIVVIDAIWRNNA